VGTHDFHTAVGLSVFLGFLGIDRFYLGYPAIGLVKLCTFGFLLVGQVSFTSAFLFGGGWMFGFLFGLCCFYQPWRSAAFFGCSWSMLC
jgi:TM2 domain-containing membrane protein YozV